MNEHNAFTDEEMNLEDVIWYLLTRWRIILGGALFFMIIAGGISYVEHSIQSKRINCILTGEIILSEDDQKSYEYYLTSERLYLDQEKYVANSILMQFDPNSVPTVSLHYYIDNHFVVEYPAVDKWNNANAIKSAYIAILESKDFFQDMVELFGIEHARLYEECIKIREKGEDTGQLVFEIHAPDEEIAQSIAELIKDLLSHNQDQIADKIGEHDLVLTNQNAFIKRSESIASHQTNMLSDLENVKSKYNAAQKNMSKEVLQYANVLKAKETEELYTDPIEKKHFVIGFLIGGFLIFGFYLLSYSLNKKLYIQSDLDKIFGIRLLGIVKREIPGTERWFSFIDKWIEEHQFYRQPFYSAEKMGNIIAADMQIDLENSEDRQVLVIGSDLDDGTKSFITALQRYSSLQNIEIVIGGNILSDPDSIKDMANISKVIMIEKCYHSYHWEIFKEIEVCRYRNITILGMIVLA